MATFGVTSATGYTNLHNADQSLSIGSSYVLSQAGTLTALSCYLDRASISGTQNIKLLLYADSAGSPGALKAVSASFTVAANDTGSYYTGAVSPGVPLTSGTYWIMITPAAGSVASEYHTKTSGVTAHLKYRAQSSNGAWYTTPPDPFGTATDVGVEELAAYGTYTLPAPTNTVAPAVTGTATVGSVLTTTNGTWTDAGSPAFTYQWQRGGVNIGSATSSTYTLVDADDATNVQCVVTDTDANGATAANSNAVAILEPVPANTVLPAVTGTTALGDTLTCSTGTWSHQGGTVATYAYQWQRDDVDIVSATASTRVIASADQGHNLRCKVTATNSGGAGTPANSAETAVPAAAVASDAAQKSGSAASFLLILGSN